MTEASVEDLLDSNLDDLADLTEFGAYPTGSYIVNFSLDPKVINEKKAVEAAMRIIAVNEVANSDDEAPKEGAEASALYFYESDVGQGKLKKLLAVLAEVHGTRNSRAIIEASKDMEVGVTIKKVKDKNDPDKFYTEIVELVV